jgi:hypothetical protein
VLKDDAMKLTLVRPVMHCIGMRVEHDYWF